MVVPIEVKPDAYRRFQNLRIQVKNNVRTQRHISDEKLAYIKFLLDEGYSVHSIMKMAKSGGTTIRNVRDGKYD